MELLGIESLKRKLGKLADKMGSAHGASVTVGFTQNYSVYVHENLKAYHPVGQAKFLEQPTREKRDVLARIVAKALKAGKTVEQALLLAGLWLQRESQLLCPVDTGALKNSAFTAPTREADAVAEEALAKSESIRTGKKRKKHKR